MRLDGALEPRPRYGAEPSFNCRLPSRRLTRGRCETPDRRQQPPPSVDEDDEATDAECLTNSSTSHLYLNQKVGVATLKATGTPATATPTPRATQTKGATGAAGRGGAGAGAGESLTGGPNIVATLKARAQPSLMTMAPNVGRKSSLGWARAWSWAWNQGGSQFLCLISVMALLPPLTLGDDGDNFFAVNAFSAGPETTTPEFDYASRGQKKFGDKCENTLECGFPGSICDPKKKSCQCTEDLPVTNHIDKCGKEAAVNESCFFNEQCEMRYFQTECRDGRCVCRFEMSPIWAKDGSVECKGRQDKRGPETYIDPAMIGVLVGMALMFVIICVVLRLFSQARWRENRTIFNTPNPRLMNVSLLRDSKLLHGQERRGSRMSVRAPSRQPSMASLRPHSPNPSLGRMIRSKSNTRSSDSRVSDVSTCSRLLEHPHPHPHSNPHSHPHSHPSAASQHNLVHSHFLPYVPTTTTTNTVTVAAHTVTTSTTYAATSATPSPTPTPTPTPLPSTSSTTYDVSMAGTMAPGCARTNKF